MKKMTLLVSAIFSILYANDSIGMESHDISVRVVNKNLTKNQPSNDLKTRIDEQVIIIKHQDKIIDLIPLPKENTESEFKINPTYIDKDLIIQFGAHDPNFFKNPPKKHISDTGEYLKEPVEYTQEELHNMYISGIKMYATDCTMVNHLTGYPSNVTITIEKIDTPYPNGDGYNSTIQCLVNSEKGTSLKELAHHKVQELISHNQLPQGQDGVNDLPADLKTKLAQK